MVKCFNCNNDDAMMLPAFEKNGKAWILCLWCRKEFKFPGHIGKQIDHMHQNNQLNQHIK